MPRVSHLFPFRTEQLSPAGPMVLCRRRYGRVGRCQILFHECPGSRTRGIRRFSSFRTGQPDPAGPMLVRHAFWRSTVPATVRESPKGVDRTMPVPIQPNLASCAKFVVESRIPACVPDCTPAGRPPLQGGNSSSTPSSFDPRGFLLRWRQKEKALCSCETQRPQHKH